MTHPDSRPPSTGTTEKEVLQGFLTYLRECATGKLRDVDESAARSAAVPSGTNLLGLVRHLTFVERSTFLGETTTNWKATFHTPDGETLDAVVTQYREAIRQANEVIDSYNDLSAPAPRRSGRSNGPSMRWALTHMIEETGRHAGHLDIMRELIDGKTGR
ncbi:DinB family protein [Rhodococcus sp. G-MC3]|uniref:DinB family protein n=1 Tax=Rhodococcus sp. G-MC3 TaxID=3046209 RepID=UPI0024B964FF|nr:DinB family protein [Rhodococcus sp. G-MC3]MDJ0396514.1 DinB family protein [Rhodococcus sp. G-MC3]